MSAGETVSREFAVGQVRRLGGLVAALHHFYGRAIINRLGEEEGRAMIRDVLGSFARHFGEDARGRLIAMGQDPTPNNYAHLPDVALLGWDYTKVEVSKQGERHVELTFCPYAAKWMALGPEAVALGRLYCDAEAEKFRALNPRISFRHVRSLLDGDECCELVSHFTGEGTVKG